jgi:hypothetical protein
MRDFIIKYWIGVGFGIISSAICGLWRGYKKMHKNNVATQKGVQALLRAQIIQVYNVYIVRGYLPIYERENIEELYDQYKELSGNGVIAGLIEKLYELPTEK